MRKAKILVVDDSVLVLEFTRMKLEEAGFSVVTLTSPFGVSSAMLAEQPDLMLLDVGMPALQGDYVVKIARRYLNSQPPTDGSAASSRRKRCRMLLYSALPEEQLRELAESCGADGYVRKSSDCVELVAVIQQLLG